MSVSRSVSDLPHVFSDNSDSSVTSSWEEIGLILAWVLGIFKVSPDKCTEFIVLGLITIVVQGLLSFHHC
jgi:hypothetical protein